MARVRFAALALVLLLAAGSCGYRWAATPRADRIVLAEVVNSTEEPSLGPLLERALEEEAGVGRGEGGLRLRVMVASFREEVQALSYDDSALGTKTVRENLEAVVKWRLVDAGGVPLQEGREKVSRTYPWSADPARLDWIRKGTLEILMREAARAMAVRLEEAP